MKNTFVSKDTTVMTELSDQILALREEISQLQKINRGLSNRLDVMRRWALRSIHVRNAWMATSSSAERPASIKQR